MTSGGFAGSVLFVDLTNKTSQKIPLDMAMAEHFGGGLGLCIKLAYDNLNPLCDALSPENTIVIGAGPLVGTSLPASSRIYGITKFPGSSRIGWCGGGGMLFGCLLKNAGYDHIIIKGSSSAPVYLKIIDDDIEICDAARLWGKGISETYEQLLNRYGRPAGVISIGQAGENEVSFSMAYVDRISTLGRGGFGAVMGSKNLKAIVVKGTNGICVADASSYRTLSGDILKKIRAYPYLKEWQDLGLLKSLPVVPQDVYHGLKFRRIACVSCPIGDKDLIKIDGVDPEQFIRSSSAVNLFMPLIYGLKNPLEAARCIATLDDYGLDMFEFFGIMTFARTLQDQGIVSSDKVIDVTSLSSMKEWAGKVSRREGIGRVLADGFRGIFSHFGNQAEELAPYTAKGMLTYVGPKGPLPWNLFGTMELGQVMDPRGPHVGASGSPTYFARRILDIFPQHLRRMGVPEEAISRILPGLAASGGWFMSEKNTPESEQALKIGRLLKYSHQWFTILGSLGICARAQINRFYNAELCAELYEVVTGIQTDLDSIRLRADRAWTLLQMANVRAGYLRKDNILPEKWFQDPGFLEYLSGRLLTSDDVERMMDDYYDEQGWDKETGIPSSERLKELGL
jgi:aldehyde:ferredoxin oxidoreductase